MSSTADPLERPCIDVDDQGWATCASWPIERTLSPNHDARPDGCAPWLIVIHNISLPPGVFGGRAIDALFTNTLDCEADRYYDALRDLRVSSHFLLRRDGRAVQFVDCDSRAWHAGVSSFDGQDRCNDFSIGIELEGDDATPFERRQYALLDGLIDALMRRYPVRAIAGHSEIAPGRKTDPGPCFDWGRTMAGRDPRLRASAP